MKMKLPGVVLIFACIFGGAFAAHAQQTMNGMMTDKPAMANERTTPLAVGALAPDFTLKDTDGKDVALSALRGQPVVIVFYRGYWCPYCGRQLSDLRAFAASVKNARVLTVSVDDPATTRQFAEKITSDGKGAITFTMLSDPEHKVIDAYGLHDPAYDGKRFDGIPHPAVYIIGKDGKIVWARVEPDYRKRPTNEEISAALAKAN